MRFRYAAFDDYIIVRDSYLTYIPYLHQIAGGQVNIHGSSLAGASLAKRLTM
jgi:hypothetical protein